MAQDDPRAQAIFETIGAYLAYTVVLYAQFYNIEHMMMLGPCHVRKGRRHHSERVQRYSG